LVATVCMSVLSVYLSSRFTQLWCAKIAEWIGMKSLGGARNIVLDGDAHSLWRGEGEVHLTQPLHKLYFARMAARYKKIQNIQKVQVIHGQ